MNPMKIEIPSMLQLPAADPQVAALDSE